MSLVKVFQNFRNRKITRGFRKFLYRQNFRQISILITISYNFYNSLYYPLTCSLFLIFTPSKSYYKIRTFRDFKRYENLCWKRSKQIGKRIAREAFLLSICLRSFFPIRPLVRLCGKRTSLEKNVGAIDV